MKPRPPIHRPSSALIFGLAALTAAAVLVRPAVASEPGYPFEGTWVRADRICSPAAPSARTYTGREVILPNGRCTVRKAVFGSGEWELFEECRRPEHGGSVTEKIRMLGPDAMLLKHQVVRLKIPRGRRFTRCNIAAQPKPPLGRSFPFVTAPKP